MMECSQVMDVKLNVDCMGIIWIWDVMKNFGPRCHNYQLQFLLVGRDRNNNENLYVRRANVIVDVEGNFIKYI